MSSLEIYILVLIVKLGVFLAVIGTTIISFTAIFVIIRLSQYHHEEQCTKDEFEKSIKTAKKAGIVGIILIFLTMFFPDHNEMTAIVGIPIVSEQISKYVDKGQTTAKNSEKITIPLDIRN